MPFINIAVAGPSLTTAQKSALFEQTTDLMQNVMHKNPMLTSVRIDEYPPTNWAIASHPLQGTGKNAVHMDIKITAGTNTDAEKTAMIEQGMIMLKDIIGNAPEASYIVIHEICATAWGYDGKTQKSRQAEAL